MPKFLIDHNIPEGVTKWLLAEGYDIKRVRDINPELTDREVFRVVLQEERILLTNDNDFVGLWTFSKKGNCIIFQLPSQSAASRIQALKKLLPRFKKERSIGLLIVE